MINFSCAQCGKHFQVGDELAGRMGKCKSCGALIFVPAPAAPAGRPHGTMPPQPTAPAGPPYPQYPQQPAQYPHSHPQYPHPQQATTPYGHAGGYQQPPAPYPQQFPGPMYPPQQAAMYGQPAGYPQAMPQYPPPGMGPPQPAGPTPMRMRRLQADAAQIQKVFARFPLIRVVPAQGELPERYTIEYRVRGLVRGPNGSPVFKDHHFAEIQLTSEYPRQSPKCRMLTPVFHPNIEPATICVGDHWTAGERLVDLVIRIAEMIGFQAYNIKSPLDGEAAMWADQNRQHLPTDHRDMHPPEDKWN